MLYLRYSKLRLVFRLSLLYLCYIGCYPHGRKSARGFTLFPAATEIRTRSGLHDKYILNDKLIINLIVKSIIGMYNTLFVKDYRVLILLCVGQHAENEYDMKPTARTNHTRSNVFYLCKNKDITANTYRSLIHCQWRFFSVTLMNIVS